MSKRVLIAISGGVDSAVAAFLLKSMGMDVSAVYMRTWQNENELGQCPWAEDLQSAKSVADHLAIPFSIVNMMSFYKKHVVEALIDGYRRGITPNPDILCNQFIKFGALLDYAVKNGFTELATGHYCRIFKEKNTHQLWEGIDETKDQSYFLSRICGNALEKILFPVGHLRKVEVRALAQKIGLPNANRRESQDICFLGGKVTLQDFLRSHLKPNPGDIIRCDGKVVGRHSGLYRYTMGQRKGIGVPSNRDFEKFVVVGKDLEKNQLIVAFESDRANGLSTHSVILSDVHFIGEPIAGSHAMLGKVRYRDPSIPVHITFAENGRAAVEFETAQRALAEGQTFAFYDDKRLLGSGIYTT
jgi:tRNA-specific 2-thiouridylase